MLKVNRSDAVTMFSTGNYENSTLYENLQGSTQCAKASSRDWDETENRPAVNGRKASSIWPAIRFHHENILQEKNIPIVNIILLSSRSSKILRISYCEFLYSLAPKSWDLEKNNLLPSNNTRKKKATTTTRIFWL